MKLSRRQALMLATAHFCVAWSGSYAVAAENVGTLEELSNEVWGTPVGAPRIALDEDGAIFKNEKLETGDDSAASVRFIDKLQLTLGANAHMVIDDYVYAGAASKSVFTLGRGAFRFVSGSMPEKNMQLRTPSVAIGIRGTELKIDVYEDGSTELSTIDGAAQVVSSFTSEVLDVVAGQSVLSDAKGIFLGGVRDFIHKSADEAVERGLGEIRSRIPIPLPGIPNPFR